MKIGIITWFSGQNYGTNLQAVALQMYLRKMGNQVSIVNFKEPAVETVRKHDFLTRLKSQPDKYAYKIAMKLYAKDVEERNLKMRECIEKNCILSEKVMSEDDYISICNTFDLLICGSDQIWNPNWYHRFYYADYPEIKTKKISYAASLGVNSITNEKINDIKRSLQGFSAISVRERKAKELLAPLSENEPVVVLDPTFLLDAEDWLNILGDNNRYFEEKYVLAMFLTDNRNHWKATRRFAKDKRLKLVIIPYKGFSYFQKGQVCANLGTEGLLNLINHAEYVLTDSFHISVFSIIFGRQFYSFLRFNNDVDFSQNSRVENLLQITKLESRLLPYNCKEIPLLPDIDFADADNCLKAEIKKSKEFIAETVKKEAFQ